MQSDYFSFTNFLLGMPRWLKRICVFALDILLSALAVYLVFSLRFEQWQPLTPGLVTATFLSVAISTPIFITFGFYRDIFRYSSGVALGRISRALWVYGICFFAVIMVLPFFSLNGIPRTVGLSQPLLLLIFIASTRSLANFWLGESYKNILRRKHHDSKLIFIYGAGSAGRQLAKELTQSRKIKVVGFIDDDAGLKNIQGGTIEGATVFSNTNLKEVISSANASEIWLAVPSASLPRRREIINSLAGLQVAIRTLPTLDELAQGKVSVADIRQLDIDDLLNREVIPPQPLLLAKNILNKVVLITGAAGSIGSELARQVLVEKPSNLILLDRNEWGLFALHQELLKKQALTGSGAFVTKIIPILGSITDRQLLFELLKGIPVDVIYHAAAYKHVPLVEHNLKEGLRNNVFGTLNLVQMATKFNVPHFILVSTDKAVRPTNVMGASKRLCEKILQAHALLNGKTNFSMVRFGNVLGSSGSVVPQFRQQIEDGGPITVTHAEVTRYFMSIPEAAQLVIQAGAMAEGGDVFVLDMGKPIKIYDLACRMVELSGLKVRSERCPEGDIEVKITGMRPGEKLYEELLIGNNPQPSSHPRIFRAKDHFSSWDELEEKLGLLQNLLDQGDIVAIRALLEKLVTGYRPDEQIVDWSYAFEFQNGGGEL